jgi:hypothetical protein
MFYWPPGLRDDPHRHDEWTVTGILHNEVVIETFPDFSASAQENGAPLKRIVAHAGETGYLVPPCVHRIQNASSTPSTTFHVFSTKHRQHAAQSGRASTPVPAGKMLGARRRTLLAIASMLSSCPVPAAVDLARRMFAINDIVVRLSAVKTLAAHDPTLAHACSRELEASLRTQDRDSLRAINARLENALAHRVAPTLTLAATTG